MPRRPERPRCIAATVLLCTLCASPIHAAGYLDSPDEEKKPSPFFFLEGGINLNTCPQASAYYEFARSWQAGLELRSWAVNAEVAYDFIPEADFHLRKLWLGAEDKESLRNSEYLDVSAGIYPSYRFLPLDQILMGRSEPRDGPEPQARITLGKYWMPFFPFSLGVDINLSLGHFFAGGHPPGYGHVDYVTAGIAIFYLPL